MGFYKNIYTENMGKSRNNISADTSIRLIGDDELLSILSGLNYAVQQQFLKNIIRDVARKTVLKELQKRSPVVTGNLRKSMGVITGKSKRSATVFIGPRMSHDFTKKNHSGWVANILEFAKGNRRYPKKSSSLQPFNYPDFYKSVGPIKRKTSFIDGLKSSLADAENQLGKSVSKQIDKEVKKYKKGGGVII